jgi:HSP20 family protein
MALIRWSPRTELHTFGSDPFLRRFFDRIDADFLGGNGEHTWYPPLDLVEEKDRLLAHLELPGIDPESVQVTLQGDLLVIQGERKDEHEETQSKYLKREHAYGSFQRSVQLPYRVQADKVKAQYKNGIMTIVLPKAEESVGRQIPVEVSHRRDAVSTHSERNNPC